MESWWPTYLDVCNYLRLNPTREGRPLFELAGVRLVRSARHPNQYERLSPAKVRMVLEAYYQLHGQRQLERVRRCKSSRTIGSLLGLAGFPSPAPRTPEQEFPWLRQIKRAQERREAGEEVPHRPPSRRNPVRESVRSLRRRARAHR